jgi:hypothetical protein
MTTTPSPRRRTSDGAAAYTGKQPAHELRQELEAMTVRELVAELARLQDRANSELIAQGGRMLPGQVHRRAELERRERYVTAELARRRAPGSEPVEVRDLGDSSS